MKLSILVSCYNAENTILKCLESMMINSNFDYEVIVVNDGSKDDSLLLINNFILANPQCQISVLNQVNQGSAQARNAAIKMAKGRFLFFCDSDDQVELPNIIRVLENELDFDICFGNWSESREIGEKPFRFSTPIGEYLFSPNFNIDDRRMLLGRKAFWASIYSRDYLIAERITFLPTFEQAGGFFVLDDLFFLFQVYSGQPRVVYVDKVLYRYTRPNDGHDIQYLKQLELQPRVINHFRKQIKYSSKEAREVASGFAIDRMIGTYRLIKASLGPKEKATWGLSMLFCWRYLSKEKWPLLVLRILKMYLVKL